MLRAENATATATDSGALRPNPQDTFRTAGFDAVARAIATIPMGEFKAARLRALDRVPRSRRARLELAVLGAILKRINRTTGYCFPGFSLIAADAGCARRSVPNVLDRLCAAGFLLRRHQRSACGDLTSNRYTVPAMLLNWQPQDSATAADDDGQFSFAFAPPGDTNLHDRAAEIAPEYNTPSQPHSALTHTSAPQPPEPGAVACDGILWIEDEGGDPEQLAPYRPVIAGQSIGIGTQRLLREKYGIRDMEAFEAWFFAWVNRRPAHQAPRNTDSVALAFAERAIPRMGEARMARMLKPSRWLLATVGAPIDRRAAAEGWRPALVAFVEREERLPTPAEADSLCAVEMRAALGLDLVCSVPVHHAPAPALPTVDMRSLAERRSAAASAHWQKMRHH